MNEIVSLLNSFEENPDFVKVFGAIIYSNRHPNIKKILKDPDYWEALNEISGPRWAIISARAEQGSFEVHGGGHPGTFGLMIEVWREPQKNKMLIDYLGLESTEKPYFAIFTRLKDGKIVKSIMELTDTSPEKSYQRLAEIITNLTTAINKIEQENISDFESVFNAIEMTAFQIRNIDFIKKLFGICEIFQIIKP